MRKVNVRFGQKLGAWRVPLIFGIAFVSACNQDVGKDTVAGEIERTGTVASALNPDDGVNPTSTISRAPNSLDVFYRGTDNQIWTTWWDGSTWQVLRLLYPAGGTASSAPAAVKLDANNMSVFARSGTNGLIKRDWIAGSGWQGWQNFGSPAVPPSPSGTGIDGTGIRAFAAIDSSSLTFKPVVVVRGSNGSLYTMDFRTGPTPAWTPTGVGYQGNPSLVNCGGATYIFIRAANNTLQWARWTGTGWTAFVSQGGVLTSSPTAVTMAANRIDVFVRDTAGALQQNVFTGTCGSAATGPWSGFVNLTGSFSGDPQAVSWGPSRIDIFARDTASGAIRSWAWNGGTWALNYTPTGGGVFLASPSVASWGLNRLDVFMRGTDSQLKHKAWDPNFSQWLPNPGLESLPGTTMQ